MPNKDFRGLLTAWRERVVDQTSSGDTAPRASTVQAESTPLSDCWFRLEAVARASPGRTTVRFRRQLTCRRSAGSFGRGMDRQLPGWADAQVIVSRAPFQVGVFASSKPWDSRGRDRRFFAILPMEHAEHGPHGGTPLPSLADGAKRSSELDGVTVLGGEAEGHTVGRLLGAGSDWLLVLAADAWIAIGATESTPHTLEIGPHRLELAPGRARGHSREPREPPVD